MKKPWLPFASYNLWLRFSAPVGKEQYHCDLKQRGFGKARQKEPKIQAIISEDSEPQRIGILAQMGVYEFHNSANLLSHPEGVNQVAEILSLSEESDLVQDRVFAILQSYYKNPVLAQRNILKLQRGDEGFPKPITIPFGDYAFNLFASIDSIFIEPDETLHILDLKTGKSDFDKRQAYVYLLAAQYLYPSQKAVASFYNLETETWSELIRASSEALESVLTELVLISQRHQKDLNRYRNNQEQFHIIFPPNPGFACQYCPFNSVCDYAVSSFE